MSEILKDKLVIIVWLEQHKIKNYTLVPDGKYSFLVDVAGDVDLRNKKLTYIPVNFGNVSGDFSCSNNQLTSLEGGPSSVSGNFYCHHNSLISLQYGPTSVGEDFSCNSNKLTSLLGSPSSVGGNFICINNQLTSLEGAPASVPGDFYCDGNEGLGEYQDITDFNVIKVKLLSDRERKMLSTSLDKSSLKYSILKI